MRAAIYTRVSLDRAGARSVAEQEQECRAWVEREGWTLDGVWTDNDRSASRYARKARPQWKALTDRLEQGGIDVLVVWEPSRATRDRRVWATLAALCEEHGIRFGHAGRLYDLSDGDDAFQLDLAFALATRESAATSKRVRRSVRHQAERGRPHGKRQYGYRRTYDSRTGQLLGQHVDEEQAAIIREMAARVLAGETTYAIAKALNARGVPSPGGAAWSLSQVKRTLLSPAYAGKRVHRGVVVGDADWPRILDEITYARLVTILKDPARGGQRDSSVVHMLTGLARCGRCGDVMRVVKNRTYLAYGCRGCWGVIRKKDNAETWVSEAIIARLSRSDVRELFSDPHDPRAAALHEAAEIKRARLLEFEKAAEESNEAPATVIRIAARLEREIAELDAQARRYAVPPILSALVDAENVRTEWEGLTAAQQREIIAALCTVTIHPTRRGERTFAGDRVEIAWR